MKFWPARRQKDSPSAEKHPAAGLLNLEEQLASEVEQLDLTSPGWREGPRVANAITQLRRGVDPLNVQAIFGFATFQAAQDQYEHEKLFRAFEYEQARLVRKDHHPGLAEGSVSDLSSMDLASLDLSSADLLGVVVVDHVPMDLIEGDAVPTPQSPSDTEQELEGPAPFRRR